MTVIKISGFLLFLGCLSYISIRSLLIKGLRRDAAVYAGLMGLTALVGVLHMADIHIPSPLLPLKMLFEPLGKMILKK